MPVAGAVLVALLAGAAGTTGCAGKTYHGTFRVSVTAEPRRGPADAPLRIGVSGLAPGERFTLTAATTDREGLVWTSTAHFRAGRRGGTDLARDAPLAGSSYRGVDPSGPLWSMVPATGGADRTWFVPGRPERAGAYEVRLAVSVDGVVQSRTTVTRVLAAPGVRHRTLTVRADGVSGDLYLPPPGGTGRAPVLLFGGSEGGNGLYEEAALLASRGHPALALCYFGCAGRPAALADIDLAYFAAAARLVAAQPGADPARLAVVASSRGTEAAQLLAQYEPGLVRDAVLFAPSRDTNGAYPVAGTAWVRGGRPLEHRPIPLDRVRGTVLAVAGGADGLWDAGAAARSLGRQHGADGRPYRVLVHPRAGHGVGGPPYRPAGTVLPDGTPLGGTRAADARARADGWAAALALLDR
ncbi:acyl-CoA thioesterase/BAAT N-terminal domain-containing protein [Streptomyces sp. NPDC101132]|uniref:acyl-CoA thioesterase/BAAT N-terminal domain-containing protein n=1 Tax=Streptomyces sp. NPDC101132 TaxID=3366110 RepID=UPI00380F5CD5